jgi:hypothetical protein
LTCINAFGGASWHDKKCKEEDMKLRKLVIVSGLVMTASIPAAAQQDQWQMPMMGQEMMDQGGMMGRGGMMRTWAPKTLATPAAAQ